MAIFKEFEEDVLYELSGQKESEGLVRISRFYQVLRAIREFLESRPEAAAEELARIAATYFEIGEKPPTAEEQFLRGDIIRQRFNPPQDADHS